MMTYSQLFKDYIALPQDFKQSLLHYLAFLKSKAKNQHANTKRKAGLAKGLIQMKDNFDDPMEDFKDYM